MKKHKTIVISGTPCTGKTTIAKKLAKKLRAKYIDVNKIIEKYKLSEAYDKKFKAKIIDIKKLNKVLIKIIKNSKTSLIIDSHLSHYLPKKNVDLCIITTTSLKKLKSRLKKRKYSREKIKENLEAEIFQTCLNEAKELKHKIKVVKT